MAGVLERMTGKQLKQEFSRKDEFNIRKMMPARLVVMGLRELRKECR